LIEVISRHANAVLKKLSHDKLKFADDTTSWVDVDTSERRDFFGEPLLASSHARFLWCCI
jgi:hypothetical protein